MFKFENLPPEQKNEFLKIIEQEENEFLKIIEQEENEFLKIIEQEENEKKERAAKVKKSLDAARVENGDAGDSWTEQLQRNRNGRIISNAYNVLLILGNDPKLKNKFAYNAFSSMIEVVGAVPWTRTADSRMLTDHDDACLRNYLSVQYDVKGERLIEDCLNQIVGENKYHPVREYLHRIDGYWDGVKRLDTLLIDYFDADDTELTRIQTRYTLVGAVMRVFHPGCKFDTVLTLKGPQNIGKSSFFQTLATKKSWFTDSLEDIGSKDAKEGLIGKWIVELGEMAAVGKANQKRAKQFITAQFDTVRLPYGKRSQDIMRQCILVASTNEDAPLKDDTGGRRWWVVDVRSNWYRKKEPLEIDQIWSEALAVYWRMIEEQGTRELDLSLPDHLIREAERIQAENTDMGVNAPEIREALERGWYWKWTNGEKVKEHFDQTCAKHVWEKILGRYADKFTSFEARNINAILKTTEGWERVGQGQIRFGEYGKQTVYQKIDQNP